MKANSMEKEFDERFCGEHRRLWMENTAMQAETDIEIPLKSFISQTRLQAIEEYRQEVREMVEKEKEEDDPQIAYTSDKIPPADILAEAHDYAKTHKEIWNECIDHILTQLDKLDTEV